MSEDPGHPLPCFYLPDLGRRSPGEPARLDEEESRHARALRLVEGARVALIDGRGARRQGRLGAAGGRGWEVTVGASLDMPARLPVELCVAVGNKAHTLWLVEKATELGVAGFRPVETERSRSVADGARSRGFWEKAERRALAALKQCGGAWLPDFFPVEDLAGLLARSGEDGASPAVLLDPSGAPLWSVLEDWAGDPLRILVGPEGGLTESEFSAGLAAGLRPARLSTSVLRFETAAIAAVAVAAQRQELAQSRAGDPNPSGGTP